MTFTTLNQDGARWRAGAALAIFLLLAISGPASAQLIGDELFDDGFETDLTIAADRAELEASSLEALQGLLGETGGANVQVTITYIGKGRMTDAIVQEPPAEGPPSTMASDPVASFSAFNPRTGNEFKIDIGASDLADIGTETTRIGRDAGAGPMGGPVPPENPDTPIPGRVAQKSWSNNTDDRILRSPLSTGVGTSVWPWRTIAEHNNRCTGTLVGPRHVVTAAHCIYSRSSNTWSAGFSVTPGRAGGNWNYGRSQVPTAPAFTWYFTPFQWRQASPVGGVLQYDFGVLILPDRLGDLTGWMGYATIDGGTMQASLVYNRGFPWCNATLGNGTPRTDDVGDDPSSGLTCNDRHLYGDISPCTTGNFHSPDADGWNRRVDHSCDGSAGQSGSPLYRYFNGAPAVIAVHTFSQCGKTATDTPCLPGDVRPLTATRFTPEYSNWISYFRNWKP